MFATVSAAEPESHVVLTSLQATYSMTSALAADTQIKVMNVPAQGAVMESQAHALSRVPDEVFKQAEAVVTISKLWRDDPLFPAARARNIRIVNIDAAFPWMSGEQGVAVMRKPVSDVPWASQDNRAEEISVFAWMSPSNAIRMAELIAADLARLSPQDAQKIRSNQLAFSDQLRKLKAEYSAKYASLADPRVLSLAEEFVYLFGDLGVYVDGWFIKQDINWTEADHAALSTYLREHDIRVVVHKWAPDAKIAAAIRNGDAQLVVLDAGDPGVARSGAISATGYQALLRSDMELLLAALSEKKKR